MPPDQRTNYHCDREATGPVNRKQLIDHINKIALETPDKPDAVPYVAGTVRGKKVIKPIRLCRRAGVAESRFLASAQVLVFHARARRSIRAHQHFSGFLFLF